MFNYLDFGVGIGVQNLLPKYIAENNNKRVVEIISTAFSFLLIAGLFVLLAGSSMILMFDWRKFFNLGISIDRSVFNWTLLVPVVLIAMGSFICYLKML